MLATGYNVIDYVYAKEKGIPVMNVPTYGTQIVGQYTVGLLLEICSHYGHHDETVKNGKWENNADWCFWDYPMIELYGKTAGIIGLGRIGQATAKILNALDMKVLSYDAYESEAGRKLAEYVDLDTLLAQSDVVSTEPIRSDNGGSPLGFDNRNHFAAQLRDVLSKPTFFTMFASDPEYMRFRQELRLH